MGLLKDKAIFNVRHLGIVLDPLLVCKINQLQIITMTKDYFASFPKIYNVHFIAVIATCGGMLYVGPLVLD